MLDYAKSIDPKRHPLGYLYFTDREHPLADSYGFVYYHRHVASVKIGRWLRPGEVVHHVDGDRLNNAPNNLVVLSTRNEHALRHHPVKLKPAVCPTCRKIFQPTNARQRHCSMVCGHHVRFSITAAELSKLVWQIPSEKIAEIYGVSGAAIAKRCKALCVAKPSRGYWAKQQAMALKLR